MDPYALTSAAAMFTALLTTMPTTAEAAPPRCRGHVVTIMGTRSADTIAGSSRNDVIWGGGGKDVIRGARGNDVICGGARKDTIVGGPGDDALYGGTTDVPLRENGPGNLLIGGPGDDLLVPGRLGAGFEVAAVVSWAGARHAVSVDMAKGRATGQGRDRIVAVGPTAVELTDHDDTYRGTRRSDSVGAGAGRDVIRTGAGPDFVNSLPHPGQEDPGKGTDRVYLGRGEDYLGNYADGLVANGGPGADQIDHGGAGLVRLAGGGGDDVVNLVATTDSDQVVTGGTGTDTLEVQAAEPFSWDMATGAAAVGSGGVPATFTGFENGLFSWGGMVTVSGTDGPNTVNSWSSTDFSGLGGDDVFIGSPEADTFDGGDGSDTYLREHSGEGDVNTCTSVENDPKGSCSGP